MYVQDLTLESPFGKLFGLYLKEDFEFLQE